MKNRRKILNILFLCLLILWQGFGHAQERTDTAKQLFESAVKVRNDGNRDLAINYLTNAISVDPNYAQAYQVRGNLYGGKQQYGLAISDLQKAIEIGAGLQNIHNLYGNLGWWMILDGRFEQAKEPTEKALELAPAVGSWTFNLGHIYLLTGEIHKAHEYYEKTIPLIRSEQDLYSKLKDFEIFAGKNWQVAASQREMAWFKKNGIKLKTVVQTGHNNGIHQARLSPDGRLLATACRDFTTNIWDTASGKALRTLRGHSGIVYSADFSPNGQHIATASLDKTAIVWDVETGWRVTVLRGHSDWVHSVRFSPDGRTLATGSKDGSARLWDAQTGRQLRTLTGHAAAVVAVNFSPDGQLLAAVSGHFVKLWNIKTGQVVRTLSGHTADVLDAGFSPNGEVLITGSADKTAKLWNVATGRLLRTIKHMDKVSSVNFSPDGEYIATGSHEVDRIWSVKTLKVVRELNKHSSYFRWVEFSRDGQYIVTSAWENGRKQGIARLWDLKTGQLIRTFSGHSSSLHSIDYSPDGRFIATGDKVGRVAVWDLEQGKLIRHLQAHSGIVHAVDFSPDGRVLASGSHDKTVKFWDLVSGQLLSTLRISDHVRSIAFSPDGQYLATGTWSSLELWAVATGKRVRTFQAFKKRNLPEAAVNAVAFSPDGQYIVTGNSTTTGWPEHNMAMLWDVRSGRRVRTFGSKRVNTVAFSPDGQYLVTGGWEVAKIWNVASGKGGLYSISRGSRIRGLAFSPDSKHYAIATSTGRVSTVITTRQSPRSVSLTNAHVGEVHAVTYSPDGKHLVSAGADATTRVWDLQSGKVLLSLITIGDGEWAAITPSGLFHASEGAHKGIHFVKGTDVYELEQFFEDFYTPNLVARVLSGGEVEMPTVTAVQKINASPPPSVEIISPKKGEVFNRSQSVIEIAVTDNGGGIDEVKLLHNGKRVAGETRGVKLKKKTYENAEIYTFSVSLLNGKNEFVASAFSNGRIESKGYQIDILFEGVARTATSYIVAVGINEYKNPRLNLNYARPDASEFVGLASQKSQRLFQNVVAETLYDSEATRANLFSVLDRIGAQALPQDVFTFYFAGHGSVVDGQFYFVTTENVRLYESGMLDAHAVSAKELQEKFQKIKALKQLVIMDACQAGAATEVLAMRGAAEEKALAQLARSAGVHVLASAGSEQFATEFAELGHGVFTYVLLQGMKGNADGSPKDGKITIYELKSFLDDQVPEVSQKYKGSVQYPNTFSKGQDFPLVLQASQATK